MVGSVERRRRVAAHHVRCSQPVLTDLWTGAVTSRWWLKPVSVQLGEWTDTSGSKAKMRKVYIGKGNKYFTKIGVAEFQIESHHLSVGDSVLITGPTTGAIETIVEEIHTQNGAVKQAVKGDLCSIKLDKPIRKSDKLYKMVSAVE